MLTCRQKINSVIHFFLKILRRISKLFILGNLGMPGHTHLKWWYHFEEIFDNYQQEKTNLILYAFLEILQRYCRFVVCGTLGISGYAHWKCYYQFVENFCVYLEVKNKFHAFLEILQNYANLFWVLKACIVKNNRNNSIYL